MHTQADGDTVYALSTGEVTADLNAVGTLAAQVMAEAIRSAVFFRGIGLRTALRRGFYEKGYRLKSTLSCFWQVDGSPVPVIQFPTE